MNEFRVLGMRLKKDGTPDKRQFRYKWHGYEEKPNRQSTSEPSEMDCRA